jgi:hypothetical protein
VIGVIGLIVLSMVAVPSAIVAVEVRGAAACPQPAAVEAALTGLIAAGSPAVLDDVAELAEQGQDVVVSLRRVSGELIAEKQLDANLSCVERARVAAVVIAAWEAKLATQPGDLNVPVNAPAGTVVPLPVSSSVGEPAALLSRRDSTGVLLPPGEPARFETGVTLGASLVGTTIAPAGAVAVSFVRPRRMLVPALAAFAVGAHTTAVGPGEASWSRLGISALAGLRRSWHRTWVEARGGIALSALRISGRSFPINDSGTTFDPGVPLGVRLGLRTQTVAWWLEAQAIVWPRGQVVHLAGAPGSTNLPRAEGLVGLGLSYPGGM